MALIPRDYQSKLIKIALEKNTIIFLPTGSGKMFIAMQVICRMNDATLQRKYSEEGGKISIVLVNCVILLQQNFQYLNEKQTSLKVGHFSGVKHFNVKTDFDKYQVIIMTSKNIVNLVSKDLLDLNKVNLIVFDECHHAVNNQPMRQLMNELNGLPDPPRVLGLTAVLLAGNSTLAKVPTEVQNLETILHSKLATVDDLDQIIKFSANPREQMLFCKSASLTAIPNLESFLKRAVDIAAKCRHKIRLEQNRLSSRLTDLLRLIDDLSYYIELFGPFGGLKACNIFIERLDQLHEKFMLTQLENIISDVRTIFRSMQSLLENAMSKTASHLKVEYFSTDKVLKIFELVKAQRQTGRELCCIIFANRRITAKVLHLLLQHQSQCDEAFNHVQSKCVVSEKHRKKDVEEDHTLEKNGTALQAFVDKNVNVLIASNVLDEGINVPHCSLVIKFDKPMDFRSYMQSKGRARCVNSLYYILVEEKDKNAYLKKYATFLKIKNALYAMLIGQNQERTQPDDSRIQ